MHEEMRRLVKEKDLCVLATASQGKPHCSLMAYVVNDDCREIYMATYKATKKYRNLMENPMVSLLIDTREENPGPLRADAKAMTLSGQFQEIEDMAKRDHVRTRLLKKHPHLRTFLENPDAAIFCIKITSFLLLDGLTDAYFEET